MRDVIRNLPKVEMPAPVFGTMPEKVVEFVEAMRVASRLSTELRLQINGTHGATMFGYIGGLLVVEMNDGKGETVPEPAL